MYRVSPCVRRACGCVRNENPVLTPKTQYRKVANCEPGHEMLAMIATLTDNKLTLVLDVAKTARPSASGKTLLVASETTMTAVIVNGKPVKVAFNATIPAK